MGSRRTLLAVAATAAVLALASEALAHGGQYQPPPPPGPRGWVPPGRQPLGPGTGGPGKGLPPTTPSTPPSGGPTTGGPGPVTGPSTGGGPLTGPGTGTPTTPPPRPVNVPGALSKDHWTRWWYANRSFVIDLHARAGEKNRVVTPGRGTTTEAELWRAKAEDALLRALEDRDEDVASAAAIALGKAGDPGVAPRLRELMLNKKRQLPVREAAALALGLVGVEKDVKSARETRRALESIAASRKAQQRLRGMAVYAMGLRTDAGSVPFLLDVAGSNAPTWDVPAAGASALGLAANEMTFEDLVRLLQGPKRLKKRETIARVYAAHGLACAGDPAAIPALRKAALDKEEQVRRAAVLALGALASPDDAETAKILHWVINRDKDTVTRNMAALSIGRIGDPGAERALRYWFKKGKGRHQPFAALGLGLLARKNDDPGIPKLLAKEFDRRANADLRGSLAIALGLAGDPSHAKVLRSACGGGNPDVQAHAAVALGLLGDKASAPVMREMLRNQGNPVIVREAALGLGLLGDRASIKVLVNIVERGNGVFERGSAAIALGRIGGSESATALTDLLSDEDRPAIARAMGAVGLGLLLDRTEGRGLHRLGADLNWYVQTSTIEEILTIL